MVYAVHVEDIPHGVCSSGLAHTAWCMLFMFRTCHVVYTVQVQDMPNGVYSSGLGHTT